MKSPLAKIAAAAVIAVACITGVVMWTGTQPSVALADVLTQVEQMTAYLYQMNMTITMKDATGQPKNQTVTGTALIAQGYGMKTAIDMTDPNSGQTTRQEQYMLPQEKAIIAVMPDQKKYVRMDLDDTLAEKMREQNFDPSSMLKQVLSCKYQSLGRSEIDGVEVEGFQTTDPNYLAGMMGQSEVKIWVDVKTRLPVRMDMDLKMDVMQMRGVMDGYVWNVSATEADFHPVIPDDYTTLSGGPVKTPAMNEEGAIAGLKLYADLIGHYPAKLDIMSLLSEFGKEIRDPNHPAFKEMFSADKDASPDEKTKALTEVMLKVEGSGMFYTLLVKDKKDPAYYGDLVSPEDTDQVLLRWKVSDSEYRVIFGNLHAETVTADALAELEKTLPK